MSASRRDLLLLTPAFVSALTAAFLAVLFAVVGFAIGRGETVYGVPVDGIDLPRVLLLGDVPERPVGPVLVLDARGEVTAYDGRRCTSADAIVRLRRLRDPRSPGLDTRRPTVTFVAPAAMTWSALERLVEASTGRMLCVFAVRPDDRDGVDRRVGLFGLDVALDQGVASGMQIQISGRFEPGFAPTSVDGLVMAPFLRVPEGLPGDTMAVHVPDGVPLGDVLAVAAAVRRGGVRAFTAFRCAACTRRLGAVHPTAWRLVVEEGGWSDSEHVAPLRTPEIPGFTAEYAWHGNAFEYEQSRHEDDER